MRRISIASVGSLLAVAAIALLSMLPATATAESAAEFRHSQARAEQVRLLNQAVQEYKKIGVHPDANPGEVCNTNRWTAVLVAGGEGAYYEVPPNTPMRIEAYYTTTTYLGHAEGYPNGVFLRENINQSTCHKT
ncbi:MAG TPA: hypothetical protein VGL37_05600 [Solirubrobacteraceae bacterium]|jgi:hypothetical protein